MGVGVGVEVGVGVGLEACVVLWTPVEDESGASKACDSALLLNKECKVAKPGSATVSSSAADESWGPEVPDGASVGASVWLTLFSEIADGSGIEGDSDMLRPMPSWYISGNPPSGLVSCPVTSINQFQFTFRVFRTHQGSQQTMPISCL